MWRAVFWKRRDRAGEAVKVDTPAEAAPPDPKLSKSARFALITERVDGLRAALNSGSRKDGKMTQLEEAMSCLCAAAFIGNGRECNTILNGPAFASDEERLRVRKLIDAKFLVEQELEWTLHGVRRTFRFWSDAEKKEYLDQTMQVARLLGSLSANVALGFGAVLGYLRDGNLIPHDDDTDLVIAFDKAEMPRLTMARQKVFDLLTGAGYRCVGQLPTHWNVFFPDGQHCDVFVGLIEGPDVSFFPSARKGLKVADIFPAQTADFFGVPCAFPANVEAYIAKTYGTQWRKPMPYWNHPWNREEYEDIL